MATMDVTRANGERLVRTPYPPIDDYGFISDCQTTALISPGGNVEWMCLPRLDGPSVFGAMLDRDAGGFRLGPADMNFPTARRYLPGTLVLETSWGTPSGWIIVRDALLMGPWHHDSDRSQTYRRAPTDYDADHTLLRTIRCVNGEVQISADCLPVFGYGQRPAHWSYRGDGYTEAVAVGDEGDPQLRLTSDMRIGFEGSHATVRTLVKEGDVRFIALTWGDVEPPTTFQGAYERQVWTAHHWQHWLARGHFPDHPWRRHLERSALTLKGLTYAPTGALVAAATTSLPETPKGERNWDYRYSWVRDSTLALWALDALGFDWEANDFFWFIADMAEATDDLQIMYGVGGEKDLTERTLDHLEGYDGAKPVRVGNGAFEQKQHDVWGALLDSVWIHTRSRDTLDERLWPILSQFVEQAIERWEEPDRGVWEVRGEPQHFVSSKVMCWVAADRGAKLARLRDEQDKAEQWQKAADEMHADICEYGVDERGVFTQAYGSKGLDASNLLIPLVGFLPPDDERLRKTVLTIADELSVHGLVLRYAVDQTDDGLSGEEGTFTICSFWMVSCLALIGELERAKGLCERLLYMASPLDLYAEELDAKTGRHLGNFPQAFTHLGLINAVLNVIAAEEEHGDLPG